jgi:hypothetical protein
MADACFLGQVYGNPTVPSTTGCFFSVHPVDASGTPTEGVGGSLSDEPGTVLVYVPGGRPPVAGDYLICHLVRQAYGSPPVNYWCSEPISNGGGIVVAGCACTSLPSTLTMTSSDHTGNNGMFQDSTLVYGPTPSAYAGLPMGAYSYLSPGSYTDQFSNNFRYYFYCQRSQFFLTRVYVTSIFGSPYEDSIRYTWTVGTSGNTCGTNSLSLTNGRVYAGGSAVNVTVTG